MKGKLIVIEGLDGSGKATQAGRLSQTLFDRGLRVKQVSYPNYQSDASAPVKMYLRGDFGFHPDDVNAYAASSLYAVDRFADYKMNWENFYLNGGIVIADRYTTSNAVHQCSKKPRQEWDSFLNWLFDFEYRKIGIPEPDAVVYLRMEPGVSQKLMTGRYLGDESKKDIHERDMDYLSRSRAAADCCAQIYGWKTIECVCGGQLQTVDDIAAQVLQALQPVLRGEE